MIRIEIDAGDLAQITKALNGSEPAAKKALKKAINDTAKKAVDLIAKTANAEYVTSSLKKKGLKSSMTINKANVGRLEATIKSKGSANDLMSFKVSPKTVATGSNRPKVYKAKVLKASSLKRLEAGGIKAFVVKFKNGHVGVAQRSGPQSLPIKTLYSPAVPVMLGGKHGYEKVDGEIDDLLQMNLAKAVAEALAKQ